MINLPGAVLLKPRQPELYPARSLVIAPRIPKLDPKSYTGNPFTSQGDVVLDCDGTIDGKPCGWHAIVARKDAKQAYAEHRKQYHQQEVGVVHLNRPRM